MRWAQQPLATLKEWEFILKQRRFSFYPQQAWCKLSSEPVAVFPIHFILYWIFFLYLLFPYLALMIFTEGGGKNRPLASLNLPQHSLSLSFNWWMHALFPFHSLLPLTKPSIYGHFHYSEQNRDFLRSVPGIQCLMNCVVRRDCGSICRRCLAVSDTFGVITETRGTKG